MSWYVLAIINVISISVGTLFQKLSMKEDTSDPVASSIIFQFLLGFITLLYALMQGFHLPPLFLLPFFILSGALYAIGTIAFFKAFKLIGASEVTVIGGAGVIMTIVASFVFLHDKLTLLQILGVFFILSAVIAVNITKQKFKLNSGSLLALLGTSSYGLAVVNDSYIIRHYDVLSYLPLISFVPGMLLVFCYIRRIRSIIRTARSININLIIFIILYAIQAISFYSALQAGALVSQISVISRASIILTVILATFFLKERKHILLKIIASVLTTTGVLLVTK